MGRFDAAGGHRGRPLALDIHFETESFDDLEDVVFADGDSLKDYANSSPTIS